MPVGRSSSSGGSVKVSRKPRVALGTFKRSGDGIRTPRSKDSDANKRQRKVRGAAEESTGSSGGVRTGEAVKTWSRKVQSRGNGGDAVPYLNAKGNSSDMRGKGKRDWKMKSESYTISADPSTTGQGKSDGNDKKFRSQFKRTVLNSYSDNIKKPSRRTDHEFKDSSRITERGKFSRGGTLDKRVRNGKSGDAEKLKYVRDKGLGDGISNINNKRKAPVATQKELNQIKDAVAPVEMPYHKKDRRIKSLLNPDKPRKMKKRGIRIDPYDTSNKRLDDSISDKGNDEVKIDKTESNDVEMSKNAQFRAICPSSSILSFVDDNLLGRRREIEFRRAGYNTELSAPLDNIPFSTTPERERIEVPAFRNKLEFFAAAKISSSFPPPDLPEIAFAGRSNVGKSSLLNALTRQWGVVRTSDKPGLTQSINFFKLGPKLSLVDLPGYGFAYAKEEVKEAWEELVKEYVMTRVGLKRVCLLIDTKWGMKPRDLELIDLMERYETKYQIVLTKTDLVFPIDVARRAMQIEENLKAMKSSVQPLMMVSSTTGAGIRSLRTMLANVARFVR